MLLSRLLGLKLRGGTLAAILLVLVSVAVLSPSVYARPPHPTPPAGRHERPAPPLRTGDVLRITSTAGTAFNVTNRSDQKTASLDLTVKVDKDSFGRGRLDVLSGTLTVGSEVFTVKDGRGIVNFHSQKVMIHFRMDDGHGRPLHMILFGKVSGLSSQLPVGGNFTIDFKEPQSKLAHEWFLQFSATATRTA